jgi:uncharacterized protein YqeY
MAIQSRLEEDQRNALREGQDLKKSTLRLALSEIKLEAVSKQRSLNDDEVVIVLRKQVQIRKEVISDAERAGREDMITEAEAEIAILEEYLPAPFPEEELENLAKEAIAEIGATSMAESGQVMKILMPRLMGKVPGGEAHQVVKKLLSKND